jgi:dephospho-CoA kinase
VTTVVGLTGNIASGKSTVAAMFAAKGASLIDAAARWPATIRADGTLDRAALRSIVFSKPAERSALDAIVHPRVGQLFREQVKEARARGVRVVVYDVPLLFEARRAGEVDVVIVVDAPEAVRRARLIGDRGLGEAEAEAMMAAQLPARRKRGAANFVIVNDADRATLTARVDAVWDALAPPDSRG